MLFIVGLLSFLYLWVYISHERFKKPYTFILSFKVYFYKGALGKADRLKMK